MLTTLRSITASRKRKLRELFAVATDEDGIPDHDFSDPDAPTTTPAEKTFLIESDILRYVLPPLRLIAIVLRHGRVASALTFLIPFNSCAGVADLTNSTYRRAESRFA